MRRLTEARMLKALTRSVEAIQPMTRREYFERTHGDREPLKPLGKPCHDCAITCGFYTPYAADLAKEDRTFQERIASRWFCHNNPDRACAGVLDYLALTQQEKAGADG